MVDAAQRPLCRLAAPGRPRLYVPAHALTEVEEERGDRGATGRYRITAPHIIAAVPPNGWPTQHSTCLSPTHVRRGFRRALGLVPGLNAKAWKPRELRHSFVSVLSDAGVPLQQISQLVGHIGTTVTEIVYRHQLRPVVQTGATVMDRLFGADRRQAD